MEYTLVTVAITVKRVPEGEMPSPLQFGAAGVPDFFEREHGSEPFAYAVTRALEAQGISPDEGCFISFGDGNPMITVPLKQFRDR